VVTGNLIAEQTKKFWGELLAEAQRRRGKH
jgi:hypothetical protein